MEIKMNTFRTLCLAAIVVASRLATAETAAQFQDEVVSQVTANVCNNEMSNVGFFAGSRAKGKSHDDMLVVIDNAVTTQNQTPTMAQLHQLMLNIAYTGPIIKSDQDPKLQTLMAKAHLACIQFMNSVASGE